MSTATFAAGCFWGVEAAFREVDGVLRHGRPATPAAPSPTPLTGGCAPHTTGHAEAVRGVVRPGAGQLRAAARLHSGQLHNPTTRNRQGSTSAASTARRSSSIVRNRRQAALRHTRRSPRQPSTNVPS